METKTNTTQTLEEWQKYREEMMEEMIKKFKVENCDYKTLSTLLKAMYDELLKDAVSTIRGQDQMHKNSVLEIAFKAQQFEKATELKLESNLQKEMRNYKSTFEEKEKRLEEELRMAKKLLFTYSPVNYQIFYGDQPITTDPCIARNVSHVAPNHDSTTV